MHRLSDWIEPLLEESLSQHLSLRSPLQRKRSQKGRFQVVEELSNLRIRSSAIQYLFLLEFRSSEGNVEATLADSSSRIETVFPREAVNLWQKNSRSLLTSFPAGSLFQVLESELRISDCFLPPKIKLWVRSFRLVGGLGDEVPSTLTDIGVSTSLRHLLNLYVQSHEPPTKIKREPVAMSSPLRSQESIFDVRGGCDDAYSIESSEEKGALHPFYTLISEAPAPKQNRQALVSKQPRATKDPEPTQKASRQETSSLRQTEQGAQAPSGTTVEVMNRVNPITDQMACPSQGKDNVVEAAPEGVVMPPHQNSSTLVNDRQWPGGRTPLRKGRYVPRYLTKLSKSQQEMLESLNAWQPSKADRQIRGSIPNQILREFTELADKAPDAALEAASSKPMETLATSRPVDDIQPFYEGTKHDPENRSDAGSEHSSSQELTDVSWSPSPRRPLLQEFMLPDNSSPLQAPRRRASPIFLQDSSSVASANKVPWQDRHVESVLPVPALIEKNGIVAEGGLQRADATLHAQTQSTPLQVAPLEDGGTFIRKQSPESRSSLYRDQGHFQGARHSESYPTRSSAEQDPPEAALLVFAPQTQKDPNSQNVGSKAQIQVHRTPFARQLATSETQQDHRRHESFSPCSTTDGSVLRGQELNSSPSTMLGTFIKPQAQYTKQAEISTKVRFRSDFDSLKDEEMEANDDGESIDDSKLSAAGHADRKAHSLRTSQLLPDSHKQSLSRRPAKRKNCSDHPTSGRFQSDQPIEAQKSRSSPVASKKQRTVSKFPSLDALRDLNTVIRPSDLARESRRTFFRSQQEAPSNCSPFPASTPILQRPRGEERHVSPCAGARHIRDCTQPTQSTPRNSLSSHTGSKPKSGAKTISRPSLEQQSMYESYKAAYPEYRGDALHFHKACKQIKMLHAEGRAPHPSLWDDFIFRRHHDYRDYLLEVTEAGEDAIPYLQYYTEYVELPSRMLLVVRPFYILSLGTDSAIGSSVKSPPLAAYVEVRAAENPKESVGASSSASNILAAPHTTFPAVAYSQGQRQDLRHDLNSQQRSKIEQMQNASVEQWVELQSREKMPGAESPELGCSDVAVEEEVIPAQEVDAAIDVPASSAPGHQPAVSEQEEKESVWCDDPDTPFKTFARSYINLASEKNLFDRAVQIDGKGCLEPQLQNVIDIFTLYRK